MANTMLHVTDLSWKKDLQKFKNFSMMTFNAYLGSEGSKRLLCKGYALYVGTYIHDVWTAAINGDSATMKAKCYAKMRKSEPEREVYFNIVNINMPSITKSYCTCTAGKNKCSHLVALFYQLHHWLLLGYNHIPEKMTCTSVEQQWHKPRGKKIEPLPITEVTFAKPNPKRKRSPPHCSLEGINILDIPSKYEVEVLKQNLCNAKFKYPLAYLLSDNGAKLVQTPLGEVPAGSVLQYQLKNYKCSKDEDTQDDIQMPIIYLNVPVNVIVDNVFQLDMNECLDLEKITRNQDNNTWFSSRRIRITSSQFGLICKRKKPVTDAFLNCLYEGKNLKTKAVTYGKHKEGAAKICYLENSKEDLKIFRCGLIVNPGIPFLGTSPDGKIFRVQDESWGLLEIKCPYTLQNRSILDACMDKKFFCHLVEDKVSLKKSHNYFYQVQGQMYVSGAEWCDFVIYNGDTISVERIQKDLAFCEMLEKQLCLFYMINWRQFIKSKIA